MSFSCRDALSDMQHDLSGSPRDLTWPWLEVKFDINFFRSTCMYSDASRRQEHDGVRIWFLAFLVQTLFAKKTFLSSFTFLEIWSLTQDGAILTTCERKKVKSYRLHFSAASHLYSFWDNSTFPKKYGISLNLTFDDLWKPQYWPERKPDHGSFEMIFDELSNLFSVSCYDA